MKTPTITIIIPTFNWSSVLPFSIGSALQQTFRDFELLVIGDACTDDSASVVEGIGDDRVHWINLPVHAGHQSGPNNAGLREARGRLIAYLGHDDLWLPHHLDCLVRAIESGADLAFGITAMMGPDGHTLDAAPSPWRYTPGAWIPPTSVVHRRHVVEQVGGWRDTRETPIDPEADLWRRVHDAGCAIESVPRLTAIKLPAIWRKDVYRERPCHEQAMWFQRVTTERDLEATLLGRMLSDSSNNSGSARGVFRSVVDLAARQFRAQVLRHAPRLYFLAKNKQRRRDRAFKGLPSRS